MQPYVQPRPKSSDLNYQLDQSHKIHRDSFTNSAMHAKAGKNYHSAMHAKASKKHV